MNNVAIAICAFAKAFLCLFLIVACGGFVGLTIAIGLDGLFGGPAMEAFNAKIMTPSFLLGYLAFSACWLLLILVIGIMHYWPLCAQKLQARRG